MKKKFAIMLIAVAALSTSVYVFAAQQSEDQPNAQTEVHEAVEPSSHQYEAPNHTPEPSIHQATPEDNNADISSTAATNNSIQVTNLLNTATPGNAPTAPNPYYGGHHGGYNNGGTTFDPEQAKTDYLAYLESQKVYAQSLLDNNVITQEQYDLTIANIQSTIDYVTENGMANNGFGGYGGHGNYGEHGGYGYNGGAAIDPETAKENALANLESEKVYVESLLDNGVLTQQQYDQAISNIQAQIDYVTENGVNTNNFGGHHW